MGRKTGRADGLGAVLSIINTPWGWQFLLPTPLTCLASADSFDDSARDVLTIFMPLYDWRTKHLASQNLWGSRELFDLQLASSGIQRALEQGQGAPACARHGAPVSLSSLPASLLCSPTGVPAGPPTLQTPAASGPVPLLASAWGGVGSPFQVSILSFLPSSIQSNILFPVKPSPLSSPLKIPNPHHWFLPLPCCFCLQSTCIPIWHNISVRYHVAPPQKHINFTSMDLIGCAYPME